MSIRNINPYNYRSSIKRFLVYLVALNLIEMLYLFSSKLFPKTLLGVNPPVIFFLVLLYILLWYVRIKKIEHEEELRQMRLELSGKDNREHERYVLKKDEIIRTSFSVIKKKFFFEYKKRRSGKVLDISEGGIKLSVYCDSDEGDEAMHIKITLPGGKEVKCNGLIVRKMIKSCTIKFTKISEVDKNTIAQFIFSKNISDCNN